MSLKNIVKRVLPQSSHAVVGQLYLNTGRYIESVWDQRNGMSPPLRLQRIFGEGGQAGARRGLQEFQVELGGLQPDDRVLEVGSGYGRVAIALTGYLSSEGSYCGLEPVKSAVRWCANRITRRFGNFHFYHADVYSKFYNPKGRFQSREYTFPFGDDAFDFVFLNSVFTHMLPDDVDRYIGEIARVLRPGGHCLLTAFLLNEESERLIAQGRINLSPLHQGDGYQTTDPEAPEAAVVLPETFVLQSLQRHQMQLHGLIHRGSWCKRDEFLSYQDIFVVEKTQTNSSA